MDVAELDVEADQAAEAAAKPAAAVEKVVEPEKAEDKSVPLAALHEAREDAKQLRQQIAELQAQPKLSAEDKQLLADLKAQKDKPVEPDFLEDPKAYIDGKVSQAKTALEKLEQGQTELRSADTQRQQFNQLMGSIQQVEAAFVKATPDYFDALNHMRTVRESQLKIISPRSTPEQIRLVVANEEVQAAAYALQGGNDPAKTAYELAKTFGYAPKPIVKETASAADKAAARTLGGSGGGDNGADPSETEDTMPDFTAALKERFGARRH